MPKISASTTIVVPAGQRLMIQGIGARATATVNPGSLGQIYDVSASGQDFFGPFDRATTVYIEIAGGSVKYQELAESSAPALVLRDVAGAAIAVTSPTGETIGASAEDSRPTIAGFGDSFLAYGWYGWRAPWGRNESTALPGITFGGMERNVTAGAHTLSYNAANRSCTFDGGPETALVNGMQIIPGPGVKNGCQINVRLATLSASNGSLTCTRTGTRPDEIVYSNSALWWFGVLSNQGYIVRNNAHSGGMSADGASVIDLAADFDAFVMNYHTNDIAGGASLAQLQASTIANLDAAYAKSRAKKGIVNGCCTYRTGWSTAQAEIADAFNRWLPGALKAYPGVVARFPWARLVSAAGNSANTALMNSDNIHPDDPAQMLAGKDWVDYFAAVLPGTPIDFGSALGVYSATNPTGNLLLNPNPVGDNSGRPTGWYALTVDANGSATPTKVARTDGVAGDWARITGNALADNVQHYFTIPNAMFVSPPANGDVVQVFVEVKLSGALQIAPVLLLSEAKNAAQVAFSRLNSSAAKALPITDWTGVIALAPYVWSDTVGTPTIDIRPGQRLLNGASGATLDIGRIWVGTPAKSSIY